MAYIRPYFNFSIFQFLFSRVFPLFTACPGDIPKNARYREKAENSGKVEIWAIFQLSNFPIGFFPLYTGRRVRLFRRNGRYTKNWEIVGKVEIWEVFPKFQLSDYIPTFQLPRCVSCII